MLFAFSIAQLSQVYIIYELTKYLYTPSTISEGADQWTMAKYFAAIMLAQIVDNVNQISVNYLTELEFIRLRNNFMKEIALKALNIQFSIVPKGNKGNIVNLVQADV